LAARAWRLQDTDGAAARRQSAAPGQGLSRTARIARPFHLRDSFANSGRNHRACAGVVTLLAATPALAQPSVESFYRGRTVEMTIGTQPGGGYDLYGRLIARTLGKHIPGNPAVVVKNMPGAGHLRMTNWLYNVAPKDGTVLATAPQALAIEQALGSEGAVGLNAKRFQMLLQSGRRRYSSRVLFSLQIRHQLLHRLDHLGRRRIKLGGELLQRGGRPKAHVESDLLRLGDELRVLDRCGDRRLHQRHAIRRHLGRQEIGTPELRAREHEAHKLALLVAGRVFVDRRDAGDLRHRRLLGLEQEAQLAVGDELVIAAELAEGGADTLNLAALDREHDVLRALVAFDHAELGAEHVVEHARQDAGRRARAGAADD